MRNNSILKLTAKRVFALLLVLFMLFGFVPEIHIDTDLDGKLGVELVQNPLLLTAEAASVTSGSGTWISDKLTYSYSVATASDNKEGAAGSVSASGNTITVKATSAKQYETGGCSSTTVAAAATTTTVTVTNASSYPLKFNSLSTTGSASVAGVSQGDTIASGATFTITVTSPANGTNATEKSGTVTVSVSEETSLTITLVPSPYVGYTVNGVSVVQNGSNQTFTTDVGTTISLPSITAPSGYEFKGWRIGNDIVTGSSFTADGAYSVYPVIVTEGTDITAANFKVGSSTYTFWEDAVSAAVVGGGLLTVNAAEVTLPDNVLDNLLPPSGGTYVKPVSGGGVEYILPSSVRLLVPYSTSATFHTTEPQYANVDFATPYSFRCLTVPNGAKLNISGSINVDSAVMCKQPNCAVPYGPHGKIVMKSGSEMVLNSGAKLYCYGYINGDGNINAKSGSAVYELMQITCWRGGSAISGMVPNSDNVFPLSQYYVQNIEAPMNIYKGAMEYLWTCGYAGGVQTVDEPFPFIGNGGLFVLTGGDEDYVTKRYHANVDRLQVTANGDLTLNKLQITISAFGFNVDINSNDYVLPLNNMEIVVKSGTTTVSNQQTNGVAFLPSSKMTICEGAVFSANAPIYFYDASEWVGKKYVYSNRDLAVCPFSTANGTIAIRTVDNLRDAELDLNGTLNVVGNNGGLYTTESGAHLTSSNATGVLNFQNPANTTTVETYQGTQSNTDMTYHAITCNNAWLQNGDDSYSYTVSTGTSTWRYDKPGEHWYRYLVDFNFDGNTIKRDYYCENNDTVTYDASWLTNLGASVTSGAATAAVSGTDVNVTTVTADSVVTLTGTPAEYIPTFVLSEEEYTKHYLLYNPGSPISDTATIDGETYYIVKQGDAALAVGTAYAAPTDAEMGVTAANHNTITWNMSGLSYTSGDPYRGTVPAGETAGGPVYIYGFYTGVVAHNSWNDQYYDTLLGAFEVLPQDVSATITLLADCGTFEEESGTVAYSAYAANNITLDLNGHHAVGRIINQGTFTLELNGGTLDFHTGDTAAVAGHNGLATVINKGTMIVQDSVGGGRITTDAIASSSGASGSAVIRNNAGATLTVTGKDADHLLPLEHTQNVNANNYGIFNLGRITALTNVDISTVNNGTTGLNVYNYNTGVIELISGGHMFCASNCSIFNYGGTINTIDGLNIDGKNGVVNRNIASGKITTGFTVADADKGIIGTIQNCHIEVGLYAIANHAVINTLSNSTFIAHPDSAQVDTRGDGLSIVSDPYSSSNKNNYCNTVYNYNDWWYNNAVWKQTDTNVKNGDTSMLQRRINEYKTADEFMPTIGTITNCTINAQNTSTSAGYGYALVNKGVINTIDGSTVIMTEKHPNNASTKLTGSQYAIQNLEGGKIGSIGSGVTVSAQTYALVNQGARYAQTDTTYSTMYLDSNGNLKSATLPTDYDYTYADVSYIGSTAATVTATSQYAILNYSKIGSITGTISANYNVIVNAGAATTTTGIEGTTANTRAIEHRYFEGNDSSTTANENRRYFEYTRNTTDGCYIGSITGTVTATGAGYSAITNQGYIGTIAGTVSTPTGKAGADYPLIYNINQRQATLKQDEYYYIETNGAGATKYLREYTYVEGGPTIGTLSCTATNPQDYTLLNLGTINNLTGSFSGKTITVANNGSGPFLTRKTIMFYSSASRFAATKGSTEVNYEYTRQQATINNITGATITASHSTASNGKTALRNYGYIGTITGSTITSSSTDTIVNGSSTITEYTSNRADVLVGCVPNGSSSCALNYDTTQTINENEVCAVGTIDTIGAGNYIQGTGNGIANTGRINTIDSDDGKTTIIYGSDRQAVYNYDGNITRRTNTDAVLTAATGTLTNNYSYEYAPAYIGTIKNVFILGKQQAILNGNSTPNANYDPVTIGEIGEGAELRTTATATYSAVHNVAANAKIELISGGVFMTGAGSGIYGLNNLSTTYPIQITGGDFRGGDGTRALAINDPDNTAKYIYPEGKKLSTNTETATYHTLSKKVLTANTSDFYYLVDTNTVTFEMLGHGTAPDSQTVESGRKATAPESPAVNDIVIEEGVKYRFDGWFNTDACTAEFDFNAAITEDTTVYAKWTTLYTVTFNASEGTGTMDPQTVESGQSVTLTANSFTREGYEFAGWNTVASPSTETPGVAYTDEQEITVTDNMTLYAQWTSLATGYHVSIEDYVTDGDGGYDFETSLVEGTYTEVTFTVYCEKACIVLWAPDSDEEDLTRVIGEEVDDDTYEFTIEGFTEDITVYIILKGDIDLNGEMDTDDLEILQCATYSKRNPAHIELTVLEEFIADLDQSEEVDTDDLEIIQCATYSKRNPSYEALIWDEEA